MYGRKRVTELEIATSLSIALISLLFLGGCSSEPDTPPPPPYLSVKGCEFTLVTDDGTTSTNSEKGDNTRRSIHADGYEVAFEDCAVVENPFEVPVYTARD